MRRNKFRIAKIFRGSRPLQRNTRVVGVVMPLPHSWVRSRALWRSGPWRGRLFFLIVPGDVVRVFAACDGGQSLPNPSFDHCRELRVLFSDLGDQVVQIIALIVVNVVEVVIEMFSRHELRLFLA